MVPTATDRDVVRAPWRAWLEPIFGVDAPDEAQPPADARGLRLLGWGAMLLAFTVIGFFRLPQGMGLDSIWAEDGKVFLSQPLNDPGLSTFFRGYAGYYQLLPRILGTIVAGLPVEWAAAAMSALASFVTALVAAYVFRASVAHVGSLAGRALLAATVVLLPVAGYEMALNLSNLHWYLHYAAFWALTWVPRQGRWLLAGAAFCFLATATDALAAIFLPLAALRLITVRAPRQQLVSLALVAGLVLQAVVVLGESGLEPVEPATLADASKVYAVRVAMASFFGDALTEQLFHRAGWAVALVALVGFAWAWLWALAQARRRKPLLLTILVLHLVLFAVPVLLRWNPLVIPSRDATELDFASRLFAVPLLLIWTGWAIAWDATRRRAVGVAAALLFVVVAAADFVAVGPRNNGPRWSDGLRAAARECAGGVASSRILIAPANGDWYVDLPCGRLQ